MAVIKTNGGYNSLPISYKRGNPIPLDKSAVWYDYDQMVAYAQNDATAYVGQILSLVQAEDLTSKAYIILNEQGDLEALGAATLISDVDDIKLQLNDIDDSIELLLSRVGAPAEEGFDASGLFAEVAKKANAIDVYTKEETHTYVSEAVAAASHLKRKEIADIDLIDLNAADADEYIYMVPSGLLDDDNRYYEYMIMDIEVGTDDEGNPIVERKIEMVGSWAVNLDDYATKVELNNEITRATKAEAALGARIDDVESDITSINSSLETLGDDIDTLETTKVNVEYFPVTGEDGSVTQVPGTLLSPIDKQKLEKLSIDDNGNIGISGTVNANNVQGLDIWISENGTKYISNLTGDNLSEDLQNKINFITAVNNVDFTVTDGTLNLNEIAPEKIVGLVELKTKVGTLETNLATVKNAVEDEETGIIALNTKITNLSTTMNGFVTKTEFNKVVGNLDSLLEAEINIMNEIDDINSRLTWQELG